MRVRFLLISLHGNVCTIDNRLLGKLEHQKLPQNLAWHCRWVVIADLCSGIDECTHRARYARANVLKIILPNC